jgi:Serine/Threonine/Tyrosine Kinase found in polyvalent proteins
VVKDLKQLKYELQNVIFGKGGEGQSSLIQSAKAYLGSYSQTGSEFKEAKPDRTEEERALREFAASNNLYFDAQLLGTYITEGAEQKVYFNEVTQSLYKTADGIFYVNWTDYFNNLLLHNYFFSDTAYTLEGFIDVDSKFSAVVKQPLVLQTEVTNLELVKGYLLENGFIHKKNNDYYQPYLGIILEDLHDENVLTNSGILFFIDTVFYLTEAFYNKP